MGSGTEVEPMTAAMTIKCDVSPLESSSQAADIAVTCIANTSRGLSEFIRPCLTARTAGLSQQRDALTVP